jgi:hypothetical protein
VIYKQIAAVTPYNLIPYWKWGFFFHSFSHTFKRAQRTTPNKNFQNVTNLILIEDSKREW